MNPEPLLQQLRPLWATALSGEERTAVYPFGEVPMTDYLRRWAEAAPERPAIVFYGATTTYAELDDLSDRFAALLAARGVRPGDRVGVFLPNCPHFIVAFWGVLKTGAVHVPVNPMFRLAELKHELADADVAAVVTLESLCPLVDAVRPELPSLKLVVTTTLAQQLPTTPTLPLPPGIADVGAGKRGDLDLHEALTATPRVRSRARSGELDELAALNYTGGTTGLPKGCEHTQRDMLYTAASAATFGIDARVNYVSLVFLPVFWIAGENSAIITPMVSGSTTVLMARWDAAATLVAIERYRIQTMAGMVDSYVELMNHSDCRRYDLSSLTKPVAISFVTRLAREHRERWRAIAGRDSILREAGYGMTETHTSDTTTRGMHADDADLGGASGTMVGIPVPGTEFIIADFETDEPVPIGAPGQILARTPSATRGYWRRPDATHELYVGGEIGGWLKTGDIGQLDERGRLYYLGRRKDMLKVNGMSVFPAELEVLIAMHPAIGAVAVVGAPDAERGQAAVAFVQVKPGQAATASELHAWCAENMARYKVPRIRIVDALPLAPTGKIDKIALARSAADDKS